MSRSLLGRDPLWFDSSKYLPIASDHVSLSKGFFLMTYVNRKWTFCILVEWFGDLRHSKHLSSSSQISAFGSRKLMVVTQTKSCFSLFLGCGAVVNNTLKSPGYPHTVYPNNMNCLYLVAIPHGMAMRVSFEDFYVEYESTCE